MKRVVLASASPRRKELLGLLDIPFEVIGADIDETIDLSKPLAEEIENLSFKKALCVFKENMDAVVIGSDTMVVVDDVRLGKPEDEEDAKRMLRMLSGRSHEVITAVSIITAAGSETFSNRSIVQFYDLSDQEIENYIKTGEPMDKAGAYAVQGRGSKYIKGIIGDFYAIMGLPIGAVYHRILKYL